MKQVLFIMTTAMAMMACGGGSGEAAKTATAETLIAASPANG